MIFYNLILSDKTVEHVKSIQKLLKSDSFTPDLSYTLNLILRYLFLETKNIGLGELALLNQYLLENSSFLPRFYDEVLISAIAFSESDSKTS